MKQIVSRGHTRPLTEISFVEDGEDKTLLVSSAHDKTPQIRNGETGDWIGTFHGHKGAVWSAKVDSLTRTLAATASGDFSSKLWCVTTGKELHEFKHKHVVKSVDFTSNTLKIATGCQDGLLRIFDTCQPTSPPQEIKIISNVADGIMKVAWLPESQDIILVCKKTSIIEKWDVRQSQESGPIQSYNVNTGSSVMDMELTLRHNLLLGASGNKVVALSLDTLQQVKEYSMPSPLSFNQEGGVSLHTDGTKFYTGGSDLWLREFDFQSGELLRTFKGHHGPIRCVRFHPRSNLCASGSEDGTIRLWDLSYSTEA